MHNWLCKAERICKTTPCSEEVYESPSRQVILTAAGFIADDQEILVSYCDFETGVRKLVISKSKKALGVADLNLVYISSLHMLCSRVHSMEQSLPERI